VNIPSSPERRNGHAIVLYGVNSNQEVLFANTSAPSKLALEDYSGFYGSGLLQNITVTTVLKDNPTDYTSIVDTMGGVYAIISEGETKSLLHKETDQIWSILEEVLKTMDLSILKKHYEQITQLENTHNLTVSLDFEPKLVTFNLNGVGTSLYKYLPSNADELSALASPQKNGFYSILWVNGNFSTKGEDILTSSYARASIQSSTLVKGLAADITNESVSVAYNSGTNKWDVTIGLLEDAQYYENYLILGSTNGTVKYDLFVVG
jgi:hypothetical protein